MKAEDKYINKRGAKRKAEIFHDVTDEQWNDWHWQVKHRITTVDALRELLTMTDEEERGVEEALRQFRMAITPYYLTLIDPDDPFDPVRKQAVPTVHEVSASEEDMEDPLQEDVDSPVFGLTHRQITRLKTRSNVRTRSTASRKWQVNCSAITTTRDSVSIRAAYDSRV
jgi:hypothetical protein